MFTPKQLALSALVAAALGSTAFAQTPRPADTADRPAASQPADRSAVSPSTTDRTTANEAERNAPATRMAKDRNARTGDGEIHRGDRKWVEHAAADGMAEAELGRIAASKASSDEVKKFAQKMHDDHTRAGDELKKIASQKGVKWPLEADRSHKRLAASLEKLSGTEFDKKYMAEMVKDHEKALKDFQREAKGAKDPDVKAFAEKTAGAIEEHLNMARQVADSVGAMRGGRSNKSARATGTTPQSATSGANAPMERDKPMKYSR